MNGLPIMLRRAEVAAALGLHPKTVARIASEGRLTAVKTPGAHPRYYTAEVRALLIQGGATPEVADQLIDNAVNRRGSDPMAEVRAIVARDAA